MSKLILLELNEVNFDYVEKYIARGKLPVFKRLIAQYGLAETTSETNYDELEPWIQWVTAHTGLQLSEHNLFRLGDVRQSQVNQIWEHLEEMYGASVAAVSPMNALNNTKNSPFFVPDPWTGGRISGPKNLHSLYNAISKAVNQNASGEMSKSVIRDLLLGLFRHGRLSSVGSYFSYAFGFPFGKWRKALILDRLLADLFITNWRISKPDFATLFVNAAAHIQHHYLFNSSVYSGEARNPDWYVRGSEDPVLEAYELYDGIAGEMLRLPDTRLMVMTGLHQDPHPSVTYYYRLKRHEEFLSEIGITFESVEPRMSRDFLVKCNSGSEAKSAEAALNRVRSPDGSEIFFVENRGNELFVMLTYPGAIGEDFVLSIGDREFHSFDKAVAFVAIKNGEHNGIGYFLDTGWQARRNRERFKLSETFGIVETAVSGGTEAQISQ